MANEFVIKNGFISQNNSSVVGSLSATTFYGNGSNLTGLPTFTGGTISGATNFTGGLSANTISATTYQNLPNTLYTGNGELSSNRIVGIGTNTLNFSATTYPNNLFLSGGSVGIGTNTPSQTLEVNGDALIRNAYIGVIPAFGTNYMSFSHISRNGTNDYSLLSDNAGITYLNAELGQSIKFRINNIDNATLDSTGNFGIGTTSPSYKLDVNGDGRFNGGLTANTISATTYYGNGSNLTNIVTSLTTSTGLSGSSTTGNITLINTLPDQTVTISGGTGILTGGTYPNFEITNTLPDQTVVLSNGTGISTSGTYPSFTITNTSPDQIVSISGGTGITTGGTYPNFTLVNSAPDQTVTITAGSGMSVTGTYPSFTIANTGETYVTGVTYSANTLTVSQNGGQSPINTTIGLRIKSGTVTGASFAGAPRTSAVTFTTPYLSTNYSIGITGSDNRTFTYTSKTVNGFTINSNANTALVGNVDWQTIATGES